MKINSINKQHNINYTGGLDALSKGLYTLSNNDMLNASFVDIFAMDTPRTIVEAKYRGKQAAIEMGFREYTGTFIAEFSATVFAILGSKLFSKFYKPEIKINPHSWATNNSLNVFNSIFKKSEAKPDEFVKNALNSIEGLKGKEKVLFANTDKTKGDEIVKSLSKLITETLPKKEYKTLLKETETKFINTLGADNIVNIRQNGHEFTSNVSHMLRDTVELGKNVFFNNAVQDKDAAISKLKTMNKSRIFFAIPLSMGIALTNQFLNRKLTKKRTGIDNFVGENNYSKNVEEKNENKKEKGLFGKKLLSAGVFLLMLTKVMGVKKPADLINKLEFTGPATGGNTIKTIYGALILGRIFASVDSTELRETTVRDYLGFLNWLVLGGFVAKGAANLMDKGKENLFNVTKEGKGIGHWLKDVSLKSQKEIVASGKDVAKNLRKLNIAQMAGIGYSALMLGVLLPKLNIWMTKKGLFSKNKNEESVNFKGTKPLTIQEFLDNARINS